MTRVKTILFCFLLLSYLPAKAQVEEDSVTVTEVTPEPSYQEGYKDDGPGDGKHHYFLKKEETTDDSLVIQQRKVPDSLVKKLQADDHFWYANAVIEPKKKEENPTIRPYTGLGQRTWFQTLIWLIIIGGFAGFLIIYLSGSNVGMFRKTSKPIAAAEEGFITEDIFAINYQKEIDKASAQGNYRLAVRLLFLRLLKNLSEKNIIQYKQDKTNLDYLLQLHPTRYYEHFFRITRNYEYSWYGQFDVNETAYRIIRNDFEQFDHSLPSH